MIMKKKKIIRIGIFILLLGIFSYSIYKVIIWNVDNYKLQNIESTILEDVDIKEVPKEEEILINEPDNQEDIYFKYKDVAMIDVDIKQLQEENEDTIGWIQVLGTNINYPIVQTDDNEYYLKHDYTKKKNTGGWIFLDYRNDINDLSENNIIYGHERYNQSMFGDLKNVLTDNWLSNTDNHIIKVSTLEYNYLFQVFSVYHVFEETYYLQNSFADIQGYQEFLEEIVKRSEHNFNTEVNEKAKILTLSTCYGSTERLVVHAKLIKMSEKE